MSGWWFVAGWLALLAVCLVFARITRQSESRLPCGCSGFRLCRTAQDELDALNDREGV